MAGPLTGYTVLDLTWGIPGPLATMLMTDYGADVIRIIPPGGDIATHPGYRVWNRGKKSMTLDLKKPEGKQVFEKLLAKADVLVESFSPGVAEKLGIGYEAVHKKFPHIVYTSISAYGQTGSDRDRPGYDGLVQARVGIHGQQGGHRKGPIYAGLAMPSYSTAFNVVIGALTALYVRDTKTGKGQHVDTSLRDGALAMLNMNWWRTERGADKFNITPWQKRLLVELFECAKGEWLQLHTGAQGAFDRLMEHIGFKEYVGVPMTGESWVEMEKRVKKWFFEHTREEGLAMLKRADVPSLPVLPPGGALHDPQAYAMKFVETIEDPELGPIEEIGLSLRFEKAPGAIRGPAPKKGQHTEELLTAAGYNKTDIAKLRAAAVI